MDKCIFCKIGSGEVPSMKIWEDDNFFAFLDNNPIREGHALVIPKKHTGYIFDLNDKDYSELMIASKKIADLLKEKLNPKRVGILVEGFGVDHVHVHLVPIDNGGEVCLQYAKPASKEELEKVADKILK